jgi:hypothetical protein
MRELKEAEERRWEAENLGVAGEETSNDELLSKDENRTFYEQTSEPPSPLKPPPQQEALALAAEDPPAKMTLSFPRFILLLGELLKQDFAEIKATSLQTVVKCEENERKMQALMDQVQQNKDRRQTSKEAQAEAAREVEAAREAASAKSAQEETLTQEQQERCEDKAFHKWYEEQKIVLAERKDKFLRSRPLEQIANLKLQDALSSSDDFVKNSSEVAANDSSTGKRSTARRSTVM